MTELKSKPATTPLSSAPGSASATSSPASSHDSLRHCIARADYYTGQINLKLFRERCPHYPVLSSNPLVMEPEQGHFVVLSKFGGATFWDCPDSLIEEVLRELDALPGTLARQPKIQDGLDIFVGAPQDSVTFNEVYLSELSPEKVRMVGRALNQSVALDHFEREVVEALRRFEPVIQTLRSSGRLAMREKEVMRAIGFALEVRSAVLSNLTLFDAPPETWESEGLARLHALLYDHFDIEERLSAINQKVGFLNDLNDTLLNALNNRKSHRLEWIIIILIVIEIVFFVYIDTLAK